MARAVSYAEQTLDSANPLTRFAHRQRYRASLDHADRLLPKGGTYVDFGAGEGTFLNIFGSARPDAQLVAIEPFMVLKYSSIRRVASFDDLEDNSVDVVSAFEVLEHVYDSELESFIQGARRVIRPHGRILVTVPIMYGLTLPVKVVSKSIMHRKSLEVSASELVKSMLGIPISRTDNPRHSHKGFDFRTVRTTFSESLTIEEESFSPFSGAPWWINSQAILVAS